LLCFTANARDSRRDGPVNYRPGYLLVQPAPGHASALEALHSSEGATVQKRFPHTGNLQLVKVPSHADLDALMARYRATPHVVLVEPDYWVEAASASNDPYFSAGNQWALENVGRPGGVADADIDAAPAWNITTSASNIVVAVVDSGVRYTHQDLASNMWVNPNEIPHNGIDDDHNGLVDDLHGINAITGSGDPMDDLGHGTKVAGAMGAIGNNGLGIAGVAWNIQIMACKFLDAQGSGTISDAVQCIDYARAHGAKIINASFVTTSYSSSLEAAIRICQSEGIIVVAAAGNRGTDNDTCPAYPASYDLDNIVSVTATTRSDGFAGYNFGLTSVDLGAPGREILSTTRDSDSSYGYEHGTSIAVPFVSGTLALMMAHHGEQNYATLIASLLAATDPLPSLDGKCASGGRLNLLRALLSLQPQRPLLCGAPAASSEFQVQLSGLPLQSYVIETSNDLKEWIPACTNVASENGVLLWADPAAAVHSRRFYRAVVR